MKRMENYVMFTSVELIKLLQYVEGEEFPTGHLHEKKREIREVGAKKLDVEPKEVAWLTKKKKQRRAREAEERREKEEEEKPERTKQHNQLLVEVRTMNSSMRRLENAMERMEKRVDEIEKSVTSLSFKKVTS